MLIYLNGTSSSGKSSTALELQKLLAEPYFYFSIDTLLYTLPAEDLDAIMGKRNHSRALPWPAILEGYFGCVSALLRTGNNVIADCPVYAESLSQFFQKHVDTFEKKLVVMVSCPLDILEQRERQRGDRAAGVAARQFEGIRKYLNFSVEYDSSQTNAVDIASAISKLLK